MKILIRKILLLSLPFILVGAYLELRLGNVENTYSVKRKILESRLSEVEILSTGSSHGFGINPKYFDYPAYTLFNNSQDIYYDVSQVEKYIDDMPNLKLVIIPISYFSFEYRLAYSDQAWRTFFYQRFSGIVSEDLSYIFDDRAYSLAAMYGKDKVVEMIFNQFNNQDLPDISQSGYWGSKLIMKDNVNRAEKNQADGLAEVQEADARARLEFIPIVRKRLDRLIQICQSKNIQVVLITVPVSHYNYEQMDQAKYDRMQQEVARLTRKFNISYFNYLKDDRFIASDYFNVDHLNIAGAEKFTKILSTEVVNPIYQEMINP